MTASANRGIVGAWGSSSQLRSAWEVQKVVGEGRISYPEPGVMEVAYAAGGSGGPDTSGASFIGHFVAPISAPVMLEFEAWVPESFDPVKGGKFGGGLRGGWREASGGADMSHGLSWSTRTGFLPDQDNEYINLVPYIYVADKPTAMGWMPTQGVKIKKGVWASIGIGVALNTPGVADGVLYFAVNGVTVSVPGILYRNDASVLIDAMWFDTFFGGNGPAAAPSTTQFARFRNPRTRAI